jgi:hypothetical protein
MTTPPVRRTATTIHATMAILAFSALAAAGWAAAGELAPLTKPARSSTAGATSHMCAHTPHRDAYRAPAGSPMPAHVFGR